MHGLSEHTLHRGVFSFASIVVVNFTVAHGLVFPIHNKAIRMVIEGTGLSFISLIPIFSD